MVLTPDDIVTYPLKQAVRGYSVPQVDQLLDQAADTVEKLTAEVEDLRRRLRQSEDRLAASSETETTLKRTLVTAQRAAEQSLDEAREEAAQLVEEARREAAGIREEAQLDAEELRVEALKAARAEEAEIRRRRQSLEGHIEALRIFEREYRARLRGALEDQLRMLDEVQERTGAGRGAPRLDDGDDLDGELPVEPSHLGGASIPDEPELRVRVRGRADARREEGRPRHDEEHGTESSDELFADEPTAGGRRDPDDDPMDDVGEVGSRPSEETTEDAARSKRRRSVP